MRKRIYVDNIKTNYWITDDGRCYNEKTDRWLKGSIRKNGYHCYLICYDQGKHKSMLTHRLVALHFIPNPQNKKIVNHKDGNKLNNTISNLEWVTSEENNRHARDNDLNSCGARKVYCFSPEKQLVATYTSIRSASDAFKTFSEDSLWYQLHKGEKSIYYGYYWSFDKELGKTNDKVLKKMNRLIYQYDLQGKFITSFPSAAVAARSMGKSAGNITSCCRGQRKTAYGFQWRYADDVFDINVMI